MKRRGCLVAMIVVVGLIGLARYGFVQFERHFVMSFADPCLFVSFGPAKAYQAEFVTDGSQDRGVSLFVPSASERQSERILVADLSWWANHFDSAVWSRDGSVIACRANVTSKEDAAAPASNDEDRDHSYKPKPGYRPYACAYDFREGEAVVFLNCASHVPRADWEAHSKIIEELLKSRGGLGRAVTEREISEQSKKLDWAQWQVYQSALRRAALK